MQRKQLKHSRVTWVSTLLLIIWLFARVWLLAALDDATKLLMLVVGVPALAVLSWPVGLVMRVPRQDYNGASSSAHVVAHIVCFVEDPSVSVSSQRPSSPYAGSLTYCTKHTYSLLSVAGKMRV